MMARTALYPGTFDPLTHGHTDLIKRLGLLFDQVIVAVAASPAKVPCLALDDRIALTKKVLVDFDFVTVRGFTGLTVDIAREVQAAAIVRGIRSGADFDLEMRLAGMNQMMVGDIDTVFLTPAPQYSPISSTLVREIAALGGDISAFVDPLVETALRQQLGAAK